MTDFRNFKIRATPNLRVRDAASAIAFYQQAFGAVVQQPVMNQVYGLRQGRIIDSLGHMWNIDTPIEEVSPTEMQRRLDEMMRSAG